LAYPKHEATTLELASRINYFGPGQLSQITIQERKMKESAELFYGLTGPVDCSLPYWRKLSNHTFRFDGLLELVSLAWDLTGMT